MSDQEAPKGAPASEEADRPGVPKPRSFRFHTEAERGAFMWGVFLLGGFLAMPLLVGSSVGLSYVASLPWSAASCLGLLLAVRPNGEMAWGKYVLVVAGLAVIAVIVNTGTGSPAFIGGTGLGGFAIVWACGRAGVAIGKRFGLDVAAEDATPPQTVFFRETGYRAFLAGVFVPGALVVWPVAVTCIPMVPHGYVSSVISSLLFGLAMLASFRRDGTVSPWKAAGFFVVALVLDRIRLEGLSLLGYPDELLASVFDAGSGVRVLGTVLLLASGMAAAAVSSRLRAKAGP